MNVTSILLFVTLAFNVVVLVCAVVALVYNLSAQRSLLDAADEMAKIKRALR